MKYLLLIFLFLPEFSFAGPRNPKPSTQDQIYQNDLDNHDLIDTRTNYLIQNTSGQTLIGQGNGINPIWSFAGRIIQVKSFTTETSSASVVGSFQASNLTLSITPLSSSSKIFIAASARVVNSAIQTDSCYFTLARGGGNLGGTLGFYELGFGAATGSAAIPMTLTYLDSPATTSATTYDIRMRSGSGVTCTVGGTTSKQSIVLVEIGQ